MTRSSNKELVEPSDELEQVLHLLRKLFKTTSFNHSSSSEFELFSYPEEHVEEEITKKMTEPTTKEYMAKIQEDYELGIARPKFDKDAKFELKGQFLKELRDHTLSRSEIEDANELTERVLELVDLFTTPSVSQDKLMLRVLPITLTGAATRWLRNEPGEEINNFQQDRDETLYQAHERFKELLLRCPQHYLTSRHEVILFYKGLGVPTRKILDSKRGYELCNGPHYTKDCQLKEEEKTLEDAYYTQFGVPFPNAGRYRAAALGFYQRGNENTSYQERRQTMKESLNRFFKKGDLEFLLVQLKQTQEITSSQSPLLKMLIHRIGYDQYAVSSHKEEDKMSLIERSQASVPSRGHLKEKGYDEKEVLMKLKKLQVN
uniref:Retrotransposon gag domain-containing protein n=1 Tax=Tanacetum cinerariifolium TaxID=118510 RepID=A0A699GVN8_TANCI|nr:hypothetical protein [Tanacetum cinerariifolium]